MSNAKLRSTRFFLLAVGTFAPALVAQSNSKKPIDYVNTLVVMAPLDQQKLIGNAPPAGEQLYSGFNGPAATLPQSSTGPEV